MHNELWVEKYRPKKLADYIFQDSDQKKQFEQMVQTCNIPHLLLSGVQGTGKTTIAKIIVNELEIDKSDVLVLNASEENSVDVMRDKIKNFISTCAFSAFKIVNLEEADYLTPNAQGALRQMMEEFSHSSRFILTCNYDNKIIPAVKSRCQHFTFKSPNKNDVAEKVATILIGENVEFDLDTLDRYITIGYPDIRKIINLLQQQTISGKLSSLHDASTNSSDYKFSILDKLEQGDLTGVRTVVCSNVNNEEWEDVYRFMYENLHKVPKFSKRDSGWEEGIVIIADHLYKHALCADPEINAAAMFIRLGNI